MIIDQYTDVANKVRIMWQSATTQNVYQYKFDTLPSNEVLSLLGKQSDLEAYLQTITPLNLGVDDTFNLLPNVISNIKNNLEISFEDYNAYMSSLNWQLQASLKTLLFTLVSKLQDSTTLTEEESFYIVKEYIQQKTIEELQRLFNITL